MKRPNGTGTVVKKAGRSKPWLAYGGAYRDGGKRVIPYIGCFSKQSEAFAALDAYNQNPNLIRNKLTLDQLFTEFQRGKRFQSLSASLQTGYKAAYKHCAPLHRIPMSEIRTAQMQLIIDEMEAKNYSHSTMHKVKVLLGLLSDYAIQTDAAAKNYAAYITLPHAEPTDKRPFTDLELKKISDAAAAGDQAAQWVEYLLRSGWRISEMLELTRFQYDAQEHTFRGGKKTSNAINRLVPVHPDVQYVVDAQISKNGATVFCMEDGHPMTSNYFREFVYKPLLDRLGIDKAMTPHACRHTFATRLKIGGADEFWRKRLLGHAAGDITNDVYTHDDLECLRAALLCYEPPKKPDNKKREAV